MTTRRPLGSGPGASAQTIRATTADILTDLPGIHLPDLDALRARGALGARPTPTPGPRRTLGAGTPDTPPPPAAP
ncbi:hypothetical protein [Streptomyces fulvorobeus]|uniref:hypothetical protein n=1 Tax=Streptomyces fulvorobeus TaxID=284028 RepID=UPI0031D7084D